MNRLVLISTSTFILTFPVFLVPLCHDRTFYYGVELIGPTPPTGQADIDPVKTFKYLCAIMGILTVTNSYA